MGVVAPVANRTSPSISVRVELIDVDDQLVARIQVPKADSIVSTSDGLGQRRRLQADGTRDLRAVLPP